MADKKVTIGVTWRNGSFRAVEIRQEQDRLTIARTLAPTQTTTVPSEVETFAEHDTGETNDLNIMGLQIDENIAPARPAPVDELRVLVQELTDGVTRPTFAYAVPLDATTILLLDLPKRDEKRVLEKELQTRGLSPSMAVVDVIEETKSGKKALVYAVSSTETLAETIRALKATSRRLVPRIPIYLPEGYLVVSLLRVMNWSEDKRSLIIYSSTETALVVLIDNGQISRIETLTIAKEENDPQALASRMFLMLSDIFGEGVDEIIVERNGETDALAEAVEYYFPGVAVHKLRDILREQLSSEHLFYDTGAVLAAMAHLGILKVAVKSVLPAELQVRFVLPLRWYMLPLFVLLSLSAAFFTYRYLMLREQIRIKQTELAQLTQNAPASPEEIRARIDSIQAEMNAIVEGFRSIDALMKGSDRWIRLMETLNNAVRQTPGTWIVDIVESENAATVTGYAVDRNQIATLMDRLGAQINSIVPERIRDVLFYKFTCEIPLSSNYPEAYIYLQKRLEEKQ